MTQGGLGSFGYKWTGEQRKKHSDRTKGEGNGFYCKKHTKSVAHFSGRRHTEETKKKMSLKQKNKKITKEQLALLIEGNRIKSKKDFEENFEKYKDDILYYYNENLSIINISKKIKKSRHFTRKVILRLNLSLDRKIRYTHNGIEEIGTFNKSVKTEDILNLYKENYSIGEIAKKLNCGYELIRARLRKLKEKGIIK